MSVTNIEDEVLSPRNVDEPGSARKRSRLDSSRKNWSLTEKLNDEESLLEMGVSFLEPDEMSSTCDVETHSSQQKTGAKRKRDLENVNPNINSAHSSTHKSPRRSPKSKQSPAPGSGQVLVWSSPSPSSAKYLEVLQQPYTIEGETPEAQVVEYRERRGPDASPVAAKEREMRHALWPCPGLPTGADSFAALSDEVMLSVFRWLPKRALAHAMLVCKRWRRVCSDESFWQRLELGNRSLSRGALGKILARQPVALRLAASEIAAWHPTDPPSPCRLQYLDLSMCVIGTHTLAALLARCPRLKKLSLEATIVDDEVCRLIGKCSNMETLNLTMAKGITSTGLGYILDGCTSLHSLNISWCGLCADSLTALSERAPQTIQRLNMAGARLASTETVAALVPRLPRLVELDLSDCSRLGAAAVAAVTRLSRLEHLALSRCYLLPPHALTRLSMMPALQYLEVWGMLQDASLAALRHALPAIQLNQFMHSAIARPTVGTRRTSIWGLRTRD